MAKFLRSLLFVSGVVALVSNPSHAQQNPGNAQGQVLEEIIVTGVRGSLRRSLEQKRAAQDFSDSVSAEDLGKFPDLNIAESLQRVPGVTLNRNPQGEGEAINLRGLEAQYTRVEVNGLTALGNGSDQNINGRLGGNGGGREFNFELLPAELFSNVTVTKSARASQTEGGMAGLVQLSTPRPLDFEGLRFSGSVQGNFSDVTEETDPRLFFTFTNNIDDRIGIGAGVAYSQGTFRTDSIEGGTWHPLKSITNNVCGIAQAGTTACDGRMAITEADALVWRTPRVFSFVEERDNIAGTFDLQLRPSDDVEFKVGALYAQLTNERNAVRPDMVLEGGAVAAVLGDTANPLVVENGIVTRGTFEGVQYRPSSRLTDIEDEFTQLSASASFSQIDNWTITPYIGYSKREADREHSLLSFRANDAMGAVRTGPDAYLTYERQGDFINFMSPLTDLNSNPDDFTLNVLIFRPTIDVDEVREGKLDFERAFDDEGLTRVNFGARLAQREKDVGAQEFRLRRDVLPNDIPGFGAVSTLVPFGVDGSPDAFSSRGRIFTVDPDLYLQVYFPNGFNGVNSQTIPGTSIDNRPGRGASRSYTVSEDTYSAYVEADFEFGFTSVNAGLRLVRTEQTSIGSIVENQDRANERINPVSIDNSYTEFLPSLSLRHELDEDLLLRAAYSKTLTRANLRDLSPAESIFVPDATTLGSGNRGNPELQPLTSDNLDLGIEWYFEEDGILAANIFYKSITNLIGTEVSTEIRTFLPQVGTELVTGPIAFNVPTNAASATIKGIEFSFQKPFSFFENDVLRDFGFLYNATLTDSQADFGEDSDIRSDGLPGLSGSSYNASFYFDNGRLDARLNYSWREQYLSAFSDDFALPRFTDDFGQMDLAANFSATENLQIQLQILNLTNEEIHWQAFVPSAGFLPYGILDLNRRIIFGARFTF